MSALLSLVVAVTLTPALAYGMPRSQSAAKHVDLVQWIQSVHYLNPAAGIYQTFSGFFSGIAWVCDIAHFSDVMGLATYWPLIIGLVGFAELRFFFGRLNFSSYRIWVGITFVVLVNATGADYFSPQSVGFVMALGIFGLVLGHDWQGVSQRLRMTVLLFAGSALAVTHELTPYLVGGVLVVLVVFKVARPWYVPMTIIAPAIAWFLLHRGVVAGYVNFSELGNLSNFTPPKTASTPGLQRLPIVHESSDALLLGLVVLIALAFIGFLRRWRSKTAWAAMLSAGMGIVLIVTNPYGNEGIFRAALFGIPWLAILALGALSRQAPRWAPTAVGLVWSGLLGTFLIAMFGLDNAGVIRPGDIQVLSTYQSRALEDSFLLSLAYGVPPLSETYPQSGHYVTFGQVLTRTEARIGGPNAGDVTAITQAYVRHARAIGMTPGTPLYAIWSPVAAVYSVDYGLETLGQAQKWRSLVAASPYWRQVYTSDGTYLFRLVRMPPPPRSAPSQVPRHKGKTNRQAGA